MRSKIVTVSLVLLTLCGNSFQSQKKIFGAVKASFAHKDPKIVDAEVLFGATKANNYIDKLQKAQNDSYTRFRISETVYKDCHQFTSPTIITFGDCFNMFIMCSGNGVNIIEACREGETFNKAIRGCSKTCKVVSPQATKTSAAIPIFFSNEAAAPVLPSTFSTRQKPSDVAPFTCSVRFFTDIIPEEFEGSWSIAFRGCSKACRKLDVANKNSKKRISKNSSNKYCQKFTIPTIFTFEDCFDHCVYCSRKGIHKWSFCPRGEYYHEALNTCVKRFVGFGH